MPFAARAVRGLSAFVWLGVLLLGLPAGSGPAAAAPGQREMAAASLAQVPIVDEGAAATMTVADDGDAGDRDEEAAPGPALVSALTLHTPPVCGGRHRASPPCPPRAWLQVRRSPRAPPFSLSR
jgi:hypothetical protein